MSWDALSLVTSLREGVQVIGPDWRYVYVNPAAAAHGRTTPDELIGRPMTECYPGIEHTEMFALLQRCMATGEPQQVVNEFYYADGRTAWFDLRIQRVPAGIAVLSIDVTRQRETERALRHAARMEALGRLAGGVAHDFNNLLTVVLGHATFLQGAAPEVAREAEPIVQAAQRGAKITGDLLAFSRRKPVVPRPVSPWSVVRAVLQLSTRVLGDGVRVIAPESVELPDVAMDPGALEQVLLNLVLNARDAMDGHGTLTIEGRTVEVTSDFVWSRGDAVAPGPYVVIAVTDTGCGLTPEVREHLFDPFFSTKGERGTGLGLSSSYGMVRQAGGTLTAHGEPGKGATFRVYLPAGVEPHRAATPGPAERRAPAGKARVLVVDDDPAVLRVTVRSLRLHGFEVEGTSDPELALARLAEVDFDLLLTDVALQSVRGDEVARRARQVRPGLRVLFMSGFSPAGASDAGEDDPWLEKPFTPSELADRIHVVLGGAP